MELSNLIVLKTAVLKARGRIDRNKKKERNVVIELSVKLEDLN